jgi:antirestriction protein ArdC
MMMSNIKTNKKYERHINFLKWLSKYDSHNYNARIWISLRPSFGVGIALRRTCHTFTIKLIIPFVNISFNLEGRDLPEEAIKARRWFCFTNFIAGIFTCCCEDYGVYHTIFRNKEIGIIDESNEHA